MAKVNPLVEPTDLLGVINVDMAHMLLMNYSTIATYVMHFISPSANTISERAGVNGTLKQLINPYQELPIPEKDVLEALGMIWKTEA